MKTNKPIHIEKIQLTEDKFILKNGLTIEFKNINLIVGDQGCGKSTLLEIIKNNKGVNLKLSDETNLNGINTFYFDSEKMNPRVVDPQIYTNPNGTSRGIGIGRAIKSRFMSHGEVLKEFTINGIKEAKDCVIFLDEPEAALSLRNQFKLAKEIKKVTKKNVQLIIATHCLPLIESVPEVYSLEHKRWMTSKEFINLNKK